MLLEGELKFAGEALKSLMALYGTSGLSGAEGAAASRGSLCLENLMVSAGPQGAGRCW